MKQDMVLMVRGDAWTPQRFWGCILIPNTQAEIEKAKERGFVNPRPASESEIKRFRTGTCLGDVADRFYTAYYEVVENPKP